MVKRSRVTPLALWALALVVAFLQRPGEVIADTKANLYVAPGRFLGDVLQTWTPTGDLGHVWGGQYNGYLLPMGPWFALGDLLGAPTWVWHRLWLAVLLGLAAWGVVRLLDALLERPRDLAHLAAGALYVINPYTTVLVDRTSVSLLAYAALPWVLAFAHRALREPRRWRYPTAIALVIACTAGGINAAVTAWVVLAPVGLAAYEVVVLRLGWRGRVWPVVWRCVLTGIVANIWWIVPLLVATRYGLAFLPWTEQPGTILGVTSLPEALRGMGFWTSYVGQGYTGRLFPFAGHGSPLLFLLPVVVATVLASGLALSSYLLTWRDRYAPFFAGLALAGALLVSAGWPEVSLLRRSYYFLYFHVDALQTLRTTYKAGQYITLGLAVLGGTGLAAAVGWLRAREAPRWAPGAAVAGAAGLAALAAWPLVTGRAVEQQLSFAVPAYERQASAQLDARGVDGRALMLPGQLFAYRTWGGTIDDVLPAITRRPVVTRSLVPYADLRSAGLQWAVDDLVTQGRMLPGQLPPLLDLLRVSDVVLARDGDRARGGQATALAAEDRLRGQVGWPQRDLGPRTVQQPDAGAIEQPRLRSQLSIASGPSRSLLTAVPQAAGTVVDGDPRSLVELAGFGRLDPSRPLQYAADLGPAGIRAAARSGATVVTTDGNRNQAYATARMLTNRGQVYSVYDRPSSDGLELDAFAGAHGDDARTIAVFGGGVIRVAAPNSPRIPQFAEHRAFAAVDGDLSTSWVADRGLAEGSWVMEADFDRPRDVGQVALWPESDSRGIVRTVAVSADGGPERTFAVRRGRNVLRLGLRGVRSLRVRMAKVTQPDRLPPGVGGIRELQIPGVHPTEQLRVPVLAQDALRGTDLSRTPVAFSLHRFTADDPDQPVKTTGPPQALQIDDVKDPEAQMRRLVAPATARAYDADAWVRADVGASDAALDRLVGVRGDLAATSSSRYQGRPGRRASSAVDGDARTAWIGEWRRGQVAWLSLAAPRPVTLRTLQLRPAAVQVRRPTRIRLVVDGRAGPPLRVGADGTVALPAPVRGRTVRIDVLAAAFPRGASGRVRARRAVGIGEVVAPGLPRLRVPRSGTAELPCGSAAVAVGTTRLGLRARVDRRAFDGGAPIRARGCGRLALPARQVLLRGVPAPLVVDDLWLGSGAPDGAAAARAAAPLPQVTATGRVGTSTRQDAAIRTSVPAFAVLDSSYNAGWRATCDGRDLGAPRPMQGYANGWPIDAPGCRDLDFSFAPQGAVTAGLLTGAVGIPLLVLLLVGSALAERRRRRRGSVRVREPLGTGTRVGALPTPAPRAPLRALGVALVAAAVVGFVLGPLPGVLALVAFGVIAWRGIATRWVARLAAAMLVVVVPVYYLVFNLAYPSEDHGGYNFNFAFDHVVGHWLDAVGVVALAFVLWRTGRAVRGAQPDADPGPA